MSDTPDFQWYDDQAGDRAKAAEDARVEPNKLDTLGAAWRTESLYEAAHQKYKGSTVPVDPNFHWKDNQDLLKKLTSDLPQEYHDIFIGAHSAEHAQLLHDQRVANLKDQQTLQDAGTFGTVSRVGASLLDPAQILTSYATGGIAIVGKAGRLNRAINAGLVNAPQAMLTARLLDDHASAHDILTTGFTAFGLGATIGSLSKGENEALRRLARNADESATLRAAPSGLTPAGEAHLKGLTDAPALDTTPNPAQGTVRYYHGGHPASTTGELDTLWVTKDLKDAKGWASRDPGMEVQYVDVPEAVAKQMSGEDLPNGIPGNTRLELPKEYANGRKALVEAPTNDSTMFEGGSLGSGQGSMIDKPFLAEGLYIPGTKVGIPGWLTRPDPYGKMWRTENPYIQELAAKTLANAAGNEGGTSARITATEWAALEHGTYIGKLSKSFDDAHSAFVKDSGMGWLEGRKSQSQFFQDVTAAARGDTAAAAKSPHIAKLAEDIKRVEAELLDKAVQVGVQHAEDVVPGENHMMRRFNQTAIAQQNAKFGMAELSKLVAGAIVSKRGIDADKALQIGTGYVQTVTGLPYQRGVRTAALGKYDRLVLHDAMGTAGVDKSVINDVLDLLTGPSKDSDSGAHARLKMRTDLDENFKMKLTAKDGTVHDVAMNSLFENDARLLMAIYTKQMTGLIGYAKAGFKSQADLEHFFENAKKHQLANDPANFQRTAEAIKDMQAAYNQTIGLPMHPGDEPFGTAERATRVFKKLAFATNMGQAGFAQLPDIANILGHGGFRAAMMHMPSISETIAMARTGKLPSDLARDLANMTGFGYEAIANNPMMNDIVDGAVDRGMTRAENLANMGAHATAHLSGLAAVDNVERAWAARTFAQKFTDYAHGIDTNKINWKKMAYAGLDESNWDGVAEGLRKYTTREGTNGKLTGIDYETWHAADPKSADAFRLAMWRESRRAVQQHTIGETPMWMHSQVGKILTQFRAFMLVSHAKQMLYGFNHMDAGTATAWMAGTVIGGLAYAGQTALNYAHDPEALEKNMTMGNILTAGINKASFSGLIPSMVDSTYGNIFNPVFSHARTTALPSGIIGGIPAVNMADKAYVTAKGLGQSIFNGDDILTKKEVKSGLSLFIPNFLGARNMVDAVSSEFPKHDPLDN